VESEKALYQLSKSASGNSYELEAFLLDYKGMARTQNTSFAVN